MADGELTVGDHIKQEIQRRVLMAEKAHEMSKKYIMVDIDGTIYPLLCPCEISLDLESYPYQKRIDYMNSLYDEGHFLHYWIQILVGMVKTILKKPEDNLTIGESSTMMWQYSNHYMMYGLTIKRSVFAVNLKVLFQNSKVTLNRH